MKAPVNGLPAGGGEGEKKNINSELWHACAGPLVSLPPIGSLVVYFPQGHSEQVAATMQKENDTIPNYPSLPSKLICVLHSVTLHADAETDEVYAQMTLQPVNKYDNEALLASNTALKQNKQPTEFFCKTLTASDTSTHGGFSVPRRAAEKTFPPLDFSMQPPAQELVAKDLHDASWTFRHVYRGQPKRHLLTTGWSVFVSTKRLLAGDSVLFIRDEKSQLLLGIRRANRQQPALSSSVLSSESMHIGVLAAAAHAAANNSSFTIFYNPRASPSEFVIPLAKYNKAMYTRLSPGMRFRMMFETEESGIRRYMGTITGTSDLDSIRWKNSQWRNLQVGWDESTAGERRSRVSIWEIEPVVAPFYMCTPPFFRPKLPKQPGIPGDEFEADSAFNHEIPWLSKDIGLKDAQSSMFPGLNIVQWMSMQQNPQLMATSTHSPYFPSMTSSAFQNNPSADDPSRMLNFQTQTLPLSNTQLNMAKANQIQQLDGLQQMPLTLPQQQHLQQKHQLQQQQLLLLQQQNQQIPVHQSQQYMPQLNMAKANQIQQLDGLQQMPLTLPQQQHLQQKHQLQQQQLLLLQQQNQQIPVHQSQQYMPQSSSLPQQQQHVLTNQQQNGLPPALLENAQQSTAKSLPMHQQHQNHQQQQQLPPQQHIQQQQLQQQQIRSGIIDPGTVDQQQKQHQALIAQTSGKQSSGNQLIQSPQTLQHQGILIQNSVSPQVPYPSTHSTQSAIVPQSVQFQQQLELQQGLSPKQPQLPQSQLQIQLQLLQNLQKQQMLSQMSPFLQSQLLLQQLPIQQNQHSVQQPESCLPPSQLLKEQQLYVNHVDWHVKPQIPVKDPSTLSNSDAPSCSASVFNNQVTPMSLLNSRHGSTIFPEDKVAQSANNSVQELQCHINTQVKQELHSAKETDNLTYQNSTGDQLEASSSATSFCMDRNGEEHYSLPPTCLNSEIHEGPRNNLAVGLNGDGLMSDTLLSRGFDSGKDLQNLLSGYGNPKDIETEISTADISSQSFGVPDMSFKPGCLNDVAMNDNGIINRGSWANQPQRMRTYTKVQKRGSVGRSIDVTRYRGYDELRHDLACMFGINGQLENPHRSDWKLVYVDHENDILLVGDDPWEEFVTCVQSIKILSAAEVQQMSLNGDLGSLPAQNQACGGSENGNLWRSNYDSNYAASFNR